MWHHNWQHNKCRSPWPISHGPVILPYILNVNWCMNIIIWDYELVWSNSWPKSKCRSLWPMYMVQWFYVTSRRQFDVLLSYFGIMWPIFHSPVILCYTVKLVLVVTSIQQPICIKQPEESCPKHHRLIYLNCIKQPPAFSSHILSFPWVAA